MEENISDIEKAKAILAKQEEERLREATEKTAAFFIEMKDVYGYDVAPTFTFVGNNMKCGWQLIKTSINK